MKNKAIKNNNRKDQTVDKVYNIFSQKSPLSQLNIKPQGKPTRKSNQSIIILCQINSTPYKVTHSPLM